MSAATRLHSLGPDGRRLVGILGVTFLLNQYDMALLGLALPQIQAELGVAEEATGPFLGAVRLGAIASLALALAADRVGRRRLLVVTIAGFAAATTLSAFAPTPEIFAALQFLARACIGAEEVIAIVLVAEGLPAAARGLGFGLLAIFGALGHGVAAILYGFVDALPFGWRALYLLGALPLPGLLWLRRNLEESHRFERERARFERESTRAGSASLFAGLGALLRTQPGPLAALLAAIVGFGAASAASLSFVSKTLQEVHGYAPHEVTALIVGGGAAALASYPVAGMLSDRLGRRPVLVTVLGLHVAGAFAFYHASGPALVPAWVAMMVGFMAADLLLGALGTEMFPTLQRATASGVRMMALAAGGALGLALEGLLYVEGASHAGSILRVAPAALVAAALVATLLPETATRELEEIAPQARPTGTRRTS